MQWPSQSFQNMLKLLVILFSEANFLLMHHQKALKNSFKLSLSKEQSPVYSQGWFRSTKPITQLQCTHRAVTGLCALSFQDNFWQLQFLFLRNGQHGKDKGVYIPIHERLAQELQNSAHIRHNHLMAAASSYSSEQSWMEAGSFEMNGFLLPTHWAFQSRTKPAF